MPKKNSSKHPYHWGEQLRSDLISEGVKQVEPLGIGALSTREVARAVGVSHAAPKHYFADRLALAAAIAGVGYERLIDAIAKALPAAPDRPPDKLLTACVAYIEFALRHRGLFRAMHAPELAERLNDLGRSSADGLDHFSNLAQLKGRTFDLFVELIREGQARGDFRGGRSDDVARVATALAYGLAREFLDDNLGSGIDRLGHARQVLEFMLSGIEAE